jgi:hypothetical protein
VERLLSQFVPSLFFVMAQEPQLSMYFVNGYGQLCLLLISDGFPPAIAKVYAIDSETLEFVLEP